jgi:hypothetical protein
MDVLVYSGSTHGTLSNISIHHNFTGETLPAREMKYQISKTQVISEGFNLSITGSD